MQLDSDFSEFVASFAAHDVRYLIVGGYALAAHGLPRATGDLDAWIWANPVNAQRVLTALEDFGFGGLGITERDFDSCDSIVQLGYPPYRIDIITAIDGVDFDTAWSRRIELDLDGIRVPFIGRADLIANKRAAGRPQDIADVLRLEAPPAD
jgi:hypothetical protein